MRKSVWNDIVGQQTRRLRNSKMDLLHASMTTTSKKNNWNLLENCHKYALKLFWNAYTWQELDDLIFYGQYINFLHDASHCGPKLVTNARIVWFHTFITHVNITNIVMWVTQQNNANWDCFKTLTARDLENSKPVTGRTLCIFGSQTFVPLNWMCKKQTAVSHSSTESEIISLWTPDRDRMVCLLWNYGVSLFLSLEASL